MTRDLTPRGMYVLTRHAPPLHSGHDFLLRLRDREILVSGLREFLADLHVSVPVSKLAKWKTTVQLVALGVLIPGSFGEAVIPGSV